MSNEKSLKINFFYNIIIQLLQVVTPLIITPYVSRILGVSNVGIYSFVNANTAYFLLLAILGISTYAQLKGARVREDRTELSVLFAEVFFTRLLTVCFSAVLFSVFVILQTEYRCYYYVQFINIVACAFDFMWVFQCVEDFKVVAIRTGIIKSINIILIFMFVNTENDLLSYFLIMALGTIIGNLSVVPLLGKYIRMEAPRSGFINRQLINTFIYFLPTVAAILTSTVDKVMIGYYYPDKFQSGYYEQAYYIENAVFTLFVALNFTMRPRMSYLYARGCYDEIKVKMRKSLNLNLFLSVPTAVGMGILASNYIPWFLGNNYFESVYILYIMIFWVMIKAVSNCLLEQNIVPNGGQLLATKILWVGTIFNILFNLFFIPLYAAKGAAIGSVLSELIILIVTLLACKREVNILALIKKWSKYIILSIPMSIVLIIGTTFLKPRIYNTLILTIVGGAIYLITLAMVKDNLLCEIYDAIKKYRNRNEKQ